MPIIEVTLAEGRPAEALRALVEGLTQATERAISAPRASVRVILREVPRTHFAAGGVTLEERDGATTGEAS